MKRKLTIIGLLLVTLWAQAQPRLHQPEIYVGLHGGVLFSLVWFSPQLEGTKSYLDRTLLSGNGGLIFRYNGHKYCGFQVELDYQQKGWRENKTDVEGVDVHYQRRLNYLEMPFLAHIYFGKKKVRGFVNLGPQIGVLLSEQSIGTEHPSKRQQYNPIENKFDWGVAGGLGMLFRSTKVGTFQIEARFNYSLGDFYPNHAADYFSHSNPMSLSANIGYLWELKPKTKIKR
ncbi:MAG: PorT family protein [Paludibacteraceae bacterium]|nr:PorT family protein [Paludibacteraceae bacterium]